MDFFCRLSESLLGMHKIISVTMEKWKIAIQFLFLFFYWSIYFFIFNFILRDAFSFYSLLPFGNVLFSFVQSRNVPL